MSPELPAPAARRSHAERSQATREHLISTAIEVVRERSFQGTTVFEVAKAAGVTPGALQHHFGSKAVLMMRVVDRILRASEAGGLPWPSAGLPVAERARQLVEALWERVYEPPRFLAAWNIYFGCSTDPALREHIAAQRAALSQTLHSRFLASFPELGGAPDAGALLDLVLSALRGMGVARLFEPDPASCSAQRAALAGLITLRCRAAAGPTHRSRRKTP